MMRRVGCVPRGAAPSGRKRAEVAGQRQAEARLFGVLGDPVDHSLSPAMHNAAFAALDLPHLYLRYHVAPAQLPEALDEARRLRIAGLNLTVPLKETVLPLVDRLTPDAARIGAANTLVFTPLGLLGLAGCRHAAGL